MALPTDIKIGGKITLTVTKAPTNAAAEKTLIRLLSKAPDVRKENKRLQRTRKVNFRQKPRGGRPWDLHVVKQDAVLPEVGVSKTITATLDVLSDLPSVGKFVEVSVA